MAGEDVDATAEKLDDLKVEDGDALADLSTLKKKKKKKPAASDLPVDGEAADAEGDDAGELNLGGKKKKKKSKKRTDDEFGLELKDAAEPEEGAVEGEEPANKGSGLPWEGSDRDYHYEELLDRVFGILRENNPELTGERRRTIIKPPQVAREGTKKTVFTNFPELCKAMNRQHEHVMAFLLAELGTSGSLDGQARLAVKGRYTPKNFEGLLRRYVNEYVLCASCKSPDTLLDRDSATRIMFLRCQQCGASRTVAPIKAGFVARTSRRKAGA